LPNNEEFPGVCLATGYVKPYKFCNPQEVSITMEFSLPADKKKNAEDKGRKRKILNEDDVSDNGKTRSVEQWSKSKKKRMRSRQKKEKKLEPDGGSTVRNIGEDIIKLEKLSGKDRIVHMDKTISGRATLKSSIPAVATNGSASALQKSFQERLLGSRFRILNEELYTTSSAAAFKRFQDNPSLFDEYHEGFRHQVSQWPVNPVSPLVERVKLFWENKVKSDSSRKKKNIVVADFGCGEAELAKQLLQIRGKNGKCPFSIHSFDLVAKGPNANLITACDSASTLLISGTVDVGIFCLSLMGTNLSDFIREGHRVLKQDGKLFIAEVRSRFECSVGRTKGKVDIKTDASDEHDMTSFVQALDQLGFQVVQVDRSNKMFLLLDLRKNGKKPRKDFQFTAKPCIYKRR
jgi:ribosomal RNA-processing protein 8